MRAPLPALATTAISPTWMEDSYPGGMRDGQDHGRLRDSLARRRRSLLTRFRWEEVGS